MIEGNKELKCKSQKGPSSRAHHMKNEPRTVVGRNQEEEGECVACGLGEPHDHEDDE